MNKIVFLGNIQHGELPTGGGAQAKNQLLLDFLQRNFSYVSFFDTWKKNRVVSFVYLFLHILFSGRKTPIILSISFPGAWQIARICSLLEIKRNIYYWVIGGDLAFALSRLSLKKRSYLSFYRKIVVEAHYILKDVEKLGIDNCDVVHNFKKIPIIKNTPNVENRCLRIVYFARIIKEKGVDVILDAMNEKPDLNIEMDFYGSLGNEYSEKYFQDLNDERISYKGFLNVNTKEGYKKLSSYDIMVFPTYFAGEGFPGVLIDAFITGLPVIVTDFHANPEIIKDGYNGYVIPIKDSHALAKKIEQVYNNWELLSKLSINAKESAKNYAVDKVLGDAFRKYGLLI